MNHPFKRFLAASFSLVVLIAFATVVNLLASRTALRLDFTENKIFTLTESTREIVNNLDTEVQIRYYFSKNNPNLSSALKTYAGRVNDLLREYEKINPMLTVERLDPKPASDAEDKALADGIQTEVNGLGEKTYFGLSVNCIDRTVPIPRLSAAREGLLEYDLTRAILQVSTAGKPRIGVYSALDVFGNDQDIMMITRRRGLKWQIITELERDYRLIKIEPKATVLPEHLDAVVLIHPAGISDPLMKSLDTYLCTGGRMVAFLDPNSVIAEMLKTQMPQIYPTLESTSSLEPLLKAWGIQFDPTKAVADLNLGLRKEQPGGIELQAPMLNLKKEQINQNLPATEGLDHLTLMLCGHFNHQVKPGLEVKTLFNSSNQAALTSKINFQSMSSVAIDLTPTGQHYPLGVLVQGQLPSAFGQTVDPTKAAPGTVALIGDSDALFDQLTVREVKVGNQTVRRPVNDNLALLQNLIDFISGHQGLLAIRSREIAMRPFTKIEELERAADREITEEVKKLKTEYEALTEKLQSARFDENNNTLTVTPEQLEAIRELQAAQAKLGQQFREAQRTKRQGVERIKSQLELIATGLIPLLVAICGLFMALYRKLRSAAK